MRILVERNGKRYAFETHLPVAVGDSVVCDTQYGPMYGVVVALNDDGGYDGPLKSVLAIEKTDKNGG